jgi:hypothetical protein
MQKRPEDELCITGTHQHSGDDGPRHVKYVPADGHKSESWGHQICSFVNPSPISVDDPGS